MQQKKPPVDIKPPSVEPKISTEIPNIDVSKIDLTNDCKIRFSIKKKGGGKIDENTSVVIGQILQKANLLLS